MSKLLKRILRASILDPELYEEVEADTTASVQAMVVVVASSLAAGIGGTETVGADEIVLRTAIALLGWIVWVYLTYFVGTRLLPEPQTRANVGELLRTIGFSSSPGLIRVIGILPGLRVVVFPLAAIWMLVAMIIAVRQALDYRSTIRAVGVCAVGWIVQILVLAILFSLLGVQEI